MIIQDLLPNQLTSGQRLISPTGHVVQIIQTRQKDQFGQPLYRVKHLPSGATSSVLRSRDDLAEERMRLA